MSKLWTRQKFSSRALIGRAMACLLFLQALALGDVLNPHFALASVGPGAVLLSAGERCDPDAQGGHKSPTPAQHDHSQCCILCSSADIEGRLLQQIAAFSDAALFPAPRTGAATKSFFVDDFSKPLVGWASSWSSRAPPFFS